MKEGGGEVGRGGEGWKWEGMRGWDREGGEKEKVVSEGVREGGRASQNVPPSVLADTLFSEESVCAPEDGDVLGDVTAPTPSTPSLPPSLPHPPAQAFLFCSTDDVTWLRRRGRRRQSSGQRQRATDCRRPLLFVAACPSV